MNIIDSSGWLEYFAGGPNTAFFSRPLQNTAELIVPSITIYEVFKTVLRQPPRALAALVVYASAGAHSWHCVCVDPDANLVVSCWYSPTTKGDPSD